MTPACGTGWILPMIAAAGIMATPARAAQLLTADAGAPLCTDIASLQPYVAARANGNVEAMSRLKGCMLLAGGLRVDVLHDYPGLGGKIHLLQVHVHQPDASPEGFMYGNGLVVK